MTKYKAYPEYKDSGVEWLGKIPTHWKISKLRYQFSFGKGLTITKEHLQDDGIPCVNYGEVHSKYGFEVDPQKHSLKCVSDKYLKDNSSSLLIKGDVVFADTSEDIDGSGNFTQLVSDTTTFAGYHTIIARPFKRENSRFYAYLLDCKELRTQVRHAVKGVKVFSVTQAILRSLSIWLPTENEQERIAAFLDHETAKIDNLIEKQQQLIELLKEKRQAVISHAVTKGLNPDVPMKDSGVEWLGEVPQNWDVVKGGYIGRLFGSESVSESSVSDFGQLPFIKVSTLSLDSFVLNQPEWFIKKTQDKNYKPESNYIVFPKRGAAIFTNKVNLVRESSIIDPNLMGWKIKEGISDEYVAFVLKKRGLSDIADVSTVPQINNKHIAPEKFPLPPYEEQLDIVIHLQKSLSTIDDLIAITQKGIELSKERRTALISAAVTGKIDVRDWIAPDAQKIEKMEETAA